MVTIQLTRDEAERLSTLLATLEGRLHWRAVQDSTGKLDRPWQFWHGIEKKVAGAFGFQAFCQPSKLVDHLLDGSNA